eukprot:TRINITY_DN7164_c0_g1_i20.p1 TRINITY_DN7164_c0_g1~~TRINITY_DN7164_c0_g1_i20.p1  ORF type:complete len:218 (-),score=36.37 TRINITY_DN7164_c0_g1_i20:101-754(-)
MCIRDRYVAYQKKRWWNDSGFVHQIAINTVTNACFDLLQTFATYNWVKALKQRDIYKEWDHNIAARLTQEHAHRIYEGEEISLGDWYTIVLQWIIVLSFCIPSTPVVGFVGLVFYELLYHLFRYKLSRHAKRPKYRSQILPKAISINLNYIPISFALGCVMGEVFVANLISLEVCIVLIFMVAVGLGYMFWVWVFICLLYTSPSPRDGLLSRMPSSA